MLCTLLIFLSASTGLKYVTKADDGPSKEALSIPIMQLARAYVYHPELFSENEKEIFNEMYLYDVNQMYTPYLSDMTKLVFNQTGFEENTKEYITLYINKFKECTSEYITAALKLSMGNWYCDETLHSHVYDHLSYIYSDTEHLRYLATKYSEFPITMQQTPIIPALYDWYSEIAQGDIHQSIPVVSMFFSPGFNAAIMIMFITLAILKKKYALLISIALPFFYWVTLLMGPCVLIRYVYPIMCCNVLWFGVFFPKAENKV